MSENTRNGINSRLEIAKEQISKFVNLSLKQTLARETMQNKINKQQEGKKMNSALVSSGEVSSVLIYFQLEN